MLAGINLAGILQLGKCSEMFYNDESLFFVSQFLFANGLKILNLLA